MHAGMQFFSLQCQKEWTCKQSLTTCNYWFIQKCVLSEMLEVMTKI